MRGGQETYETCQAIDKNFDELETLPSCGTAKPFQWDWKQLGVEVKIDNWNERNKVLIHNNRGNFIERRKGGKIELGTEVLFFLTKRAAIWFMAKEIGCLILRIVKTLFRRDASL